jgi:hypothetical protein
MSGRFAINLFLVPARDLHGMLDKSHRTLLRSGFEVVADESVEDAVLPVGKGALAFRPDTLTSFEVQISWRGDPGTQLVKAVCLHFTGQLDRHGGLEAVKRLVTAARQLHADLGAARGLWGWDLDASSDYRWTDEWRRLSEGTIEGRYWLDIIDLGLVDSDVVQSLRTGDERDFVESDVLFIRRSAWP